MILTIDVGNTSTAFGLFDGEQMVLHFRRTTDVHSSSDEIGVFMRSVLRENGFDHTKIDRIGCCSVVPPVDFSLSRACSKYLGHEPLFIQAGIKTGLKLRYSNPKEIGADLIAAAMGAVTRCPGKNLVIIDMGTATTAELVSKDGEFLGGVIMPGLKISIDALASRTAKLPSVEIARPEHVYGTTTTEAIQAGLYYGNLGAMKELCYLFKKNVFHGEDVFIIGTGGFSSSYADSNLFDEVIPGLVLSGVRRAIEINS